jgi:hypothetical protein
MSKHTPGPWKIWNSGYANCPNVIYFGPHAPRLNRDGLLTMPTAEGGTIAEVRTDESPTRQELEANAKLIAAAPDLLATLKGLIESDHDPRMCEWVGCPQCPAIKLIWKLEGRHVA